MIPRHDGTDFYGNKYPTVHLPQAYRAKDFRQLTHNFVENHTHTQYKNKWMWQRGMRKKPHRNFILYSLALSGCPHRHIYSHWNMCKVFLSILFSITRFPTTLSGNSLLSKCLSVSVCVYVFVCVSMLVLCVYMCVCLSCSKIMQTDNIACHLVWVHVYTWDMGMVFCVSWIKRHLVYRLSFACVWMARRSESLEEDTLAPRTCRSRSLFKQSRR